jgi:hypothetical protein
LYDFFLCKSETNEYLTNIFEQDLYLEMGEESFEEKPTRLSKKTNVDDGNDERILRKLKEK